MNRFSRFISIVLIPIIILFIVFLPRCVDDELHRNRFEEWLDHEKEEYTGSISVWHVVGFRPYIGSVGNIIKDAAKSVEKRHFGVYITVTALSAEDAAQRMANGEFPDALSFPAGFIDESRLRAFTEDETAGFERLADLSGGELNSVIYALPFTASCELVIYCQSKVSSDEIDIEQAEQNSLEDFKKGSVSCCVADARAVGDLMRKVLAGKADYFDVLPLDRGSKLVQYLGISRDCIEVKIPYINELFSGLFSEKKQKELCELGLYPLAREAELVYEQQFLSEAYEMLRQRNDFIGFAEGN